MNIHIVTGRVTQDGEFKDLTNTKIYTNTIAVKRQNKENGEYLTDFFKFVVLGNYAEVVRDICKKGQLIEIAGEHQNRINKSGDKTYTNAQIVVDRFFILESKKDDAEQSQTQNNNTTPAQVDEEDPFAFGETP